jgi:hypothetical protein
MIIYWNKYYGYDERFSDEPNYRAISGILFNREFTLIIIWSKLQIHLSMIDLNKWNPFYGPPKRKWYHFTF